jgi:glycosyltransferase involved in cell wall biosynthesis
MRIDQLLPSFTPHDAISNHALMVRQSLIRAGYQSDIYADIINPPFDREARPATECQRAPDPERVLLYHGSTESESVRWLEAAARQGQRLAVNYHNITPAGYFTPWDPATAKRSKAGRRQMARLAAVVGLAIADSAYNRAELDGWGYAHAVVSPLLLDLPPMGGSRPVGGTSNWLFVGRIAPNKCHHDVIAAFAVYQRLYQPEARLTFVGWSAIPSYLAALRDLAAALGVSARVEWRNGISLTELVSAYRAADALVCLSEHEGFCVPLVEAMAAGVPVVAYRAAAVPETVGSAGVLLDSKEPLTVAAEVHELLSDPARLSSLVSAGTARAAGLTRAETSGQFVGHLRNWLAGRP